MLGLKSYDFFTHPCTFEKVHLITAQFQTNLGSECLNQSHWNLARALNILLKPGENVCLNSCMCKSLLDLSPI